MFVFTLTKKKEREKEREEGEEGKRMADEREEQGRTMRENWVSKYMNQYSEYL